MVISGNLLGCFYAVGRLFRQTKKVAAETVGSIINTEPGKSSEKVKAPRKEDIARKRLEDIEQEGILGQEIFDHFGVKEKEDGPYYCNVSSLKMEEKGDSVDKNEEQPSMWDYDQRRLPKEFDDLDQRTFLGDPVSHKLCFLELDVLIRICEMLPVVDFLELSLTCRFIHWRMFTFCRCYAPYTVTVIIIDSIIQKNTRYLVMPKMVYRFGGKGGLPLSTSYNRDSHSRHHLYYADQLGYRGVAVIQPDPPCLKKPFIFANLEMVLFLPFFDKQCYDRCLPHLLGLRQYTRRLGITLVYNFFDFIPQFFNYPATDDFLKALNATTYDRWYSLDERIKCSENAGIYLNCPYARQMDEVWISDCSALTDGIFSNRIGYYCYTSDDMVKRTLREFFYGSTNLDFHGYLYLRREQGRYPLLEYLFDQYGGFEEFYSSRYGHVWYTTIITEETGRRHRMRIVKTTRNAKLLIGKEENFDETNILHRKRLHYQDIVDGSLGQMWHMKTAVEGDGEGDETERDEEEEDTELDGEGEETELDEERQETEVDEEGDETERDEEGEETAWEEGKREETTEQTFLNK